MGTPARSWEEKLESLTRHDCMRFSRIAETLQFGLVYSLLGAICGTLLDIWCSPLYPSQKERGPWVKIRVVLAASLQAALAAVLVIYIRKIAQLVPFLFSFCDGYVQHLHVNGVRWRACPCPCVRRLPAKSRCAAWAGLARHLALSSSLAGSQNGRTWTVVSERPSRRERSEVAREDVRNPGRAEYVSLTVSATLSFNRSPAVPPNALHFPRKCARTHPFVSASQRVTSAGSARLASRGAASCKRSAMPSDA